MKSFRLDSNSFKDAIESWPAIIAAVALCALFVTILAFVIINRRDPDVLR